ncbi:hypothetical protein [Limnospira fusiformis]
MVATQIGRSPHFFALRDGGVGFRTSTQPTQMGEKGDRLIFSH